MKKYAYYSKGKKTMWFPLRTKNPWRRIKRWVPSRIEYLKSIGIDANLENYTEYGNIEALEPDIVLILDKLRLEAEGGEILFHCNVCNKILQVEKLKSCKCLNPEFITDFYREQKAIEVAFLEEVHRIKKLVSDHV